MSSKLDNLQFTLFMVTRQVGDWRITIHDTGWYESGFLGKSRSIMEREDVWANSQKCAKTEMNWVMGEQIWYMDSLPNTLTSYLGRLKGPGLSTLFCLVSSVSGCGKIVALQATFFQAPACQCLWRDRLVFLNVNKDDIIQGAG